MPLPKSSVFCATSYIRNITAEGWGNSNIPKDFALEFLTATYCGIFINVKLSRVMDEKAKAELIAQAENEEAIRDFFTEWWTVEQLYETAAKTVVSILRNTCDEDRKDFEELMRQHLMMIDLMKPFAENDEKRAGEKRTASRW